MAVENLPEGPQIPADNRICETLLLLSALKLSTWSIKENCGVINK